MVAWCPDSSRDESNQMRKPQEGEVIIGGGCDSDLQTDLYII